ncbi:MAG: zinc ribbon domain-containing protein [archaeon]
MTDLPGVVWCAVGTLISVVSFFAIVVNRVQKSFFFFVMIAVGIGMFIYGVIKIMNMRKKTEQEIDQKLKNSRFSKENGEEEIVAPRPNPAAQRQVPQYAAKSGPFSNSTGNLTGVSSNQQHTGHQAHTPQNYAQQSQVSQSNHQANYAQQHQSGNISSSGYGHSNINAAGHPQPQTAQHAAKRYCPSCGAQLASHHRFCASCGSKI